MPSTLTTTPHLTFQSSVHYLTGERSRMCTMYYFHIPPSIPLLQWKASPFFFQTIQLFQTSRTVVKCSLCAHRVLIQNKPANVTRYRLGPPGLDLTKAFTSTSLEFDIGGFRGQTLKSEGPQKRTPGIPLPTFQLHLQKLFHPPTYFPRSLASLRDPSQAPATC